MGDTLDQEVQALKQWLAQAWRHLGEPALTRLERRELRNEMKAADAALRAGLQKLASRNRAVSGLRNSFRQAVPQPQFRMLKLDEA